MSPRPGQWIHMVGIAGVGMSGIAKVLYQQGYKVSGSDLQCNDITKQLEELGIEIFKGHSSSHVKEEVDLLVVSSAIPGDNAEVLTARQRNIPVIKRGQMLARLVNRSRGIAVAGAHGKTTTTSMVYTVLNDCGQDPSFIVGGELQEIHLNARLGTGEYFVVEADESDASFLELQPYLAIITNVEDDHLDYYKTFERVKQAFYEFLNKVHPEGLALVYGQDGCAQRFKESSPTRVLLYGEKESDDFYMKNWQVSGIGSSFDVYRRGELLGNVEIKVPGKYNALNGLAAISAGLELGLDFDNIRHSLSRFKGAKRRFEFIGEADGRKVVDDYAHHPTEIRSCIEAALSLRKGRLVVVFQPHRFTRTHTLGKQIGEALQGADLVIITDVYAAGENPIPGVSGEKVFQAASRKGCNAVYLPDLEDVCKYLVKNTRKDDLIMTMGAGDIWKVGPQVLPMIRKTEPQV
ncbi:UDP-N-acetylmuramate--L-alanine ligase [Syntrophomonas erecta]